MKKDVVIRVENLGKKYQIGKNQSYLTLRDQLVTFPQKIFRKQKTEEFWALKNVSFEVSRGEVIGIIGKNGAGKSTLLKILSRIVEPTEGKVIMRGKVASLLEVGTGFNPELTGRENIYLNGAILGMSRKEIDEKFAEIVKFSGVKKFLHTPVKRYSSGMYVRLAFAVAAHLDSDILLVDEVLAVGDTKFQKKCLGKMEDLSKQGKTVIFVSHNLSAIKNLCDRTAVINKGKVVFEATPGEAVEYYLKEKTSHKNCCDFKQIDGPAQIKNVGLINDSKRKNEFRINEPINIGVNVIFRKVGLKAYLVLSVINRENEKIILGRDIEMNSDFQKARKKGNYRYVITIPKNVLAPGNYFIEVALVDFNSRKPFHLPSNNLAFYIEGKNSARRKLGFSWISKTSVPITFALDKE